MGDAVLVPQWFCPQRCPFTTPIGKREERLLFVLIRNLLCCLTQHFQRLCTGPRTHTPPISLQRFELVAAVGQPRCILELLTSEKTHNWPAGSPWFLDGKPRGSLS